MIGNHLFLKCFDVIAIIRVFCDFVSIPAISVLHLVFQVFQT